MPPALTCCANGAPGPEVEVLARLSAAGLAGLGARIDSLAERLRERAAEPAELHAQIALLRSGARSKRLRTMGPTPDATAPPDQQEALASLLQSRSWRLTAPLRRASAALHRMRGR